MSFLLQQKPIVVEVLKQPEPARDISADVVVNVFLMPFVVLLVLILGGAIVAGGVILYKRWRATTESVGEQPFTRLEL